jgi:PKD repeat protein
MQTKFGIFIALMILINTNPIVHCSKDFNPLNVVEICEQIIDSDEDRIFFYNSVNTIGIGRPEGGSRERGIRITSAELSGYDNWYMTAVCFFLSAIGGRQAIVRVYGPGTPSSPGSLLQSISASVMCPGWKRIELQSDIQLDSSEEVWVSIEMHNDVGEFPQGADGGPAVDGKGDWHKLSGVWQEAQYDINNSVDRNWNIEAIVNQYKPMASYSYSPLYPDINEEITFDGSESGDDNGNIVSYSWDFDDGHIKNGLVVIHSFPQKGCYDVTLTVTDNDGHTDSTYRGIKVGYSPPTAHFNYTPEHPRVNDEIMFDASDCEDEDGYIVNYHWYFGDTGTATGEQVIHSFVEQGSYLVELFITDNDGETDHTQKTVLISDQDVPIAVIDDIYPNPASNKNIISFLGHGEDLDGEIISYHWESSLDGILSNESSFEVKGLSIGIHEIKFKVQDNDEQWSNVTTDILEVIEYVNNPPDKPELEGPTDGKIGVEYPFYATSVDPEGDQVWYAFDWGIVDQIVVWQGPYDSGETVEAFVVWSDPGTYLIQVKAKDVLDMESPWSDPIEIGMVRKPLFSFVSMFVLWLFEQFPFFEIFLSIN